MNTDRADFQNALAHTDRRAAKHDRGMVPVDFGATAVTGMHVSCVAALRDYYGLKKIPVKVVDPFQMLGEIDGELKNAMGVTVEGVLGPYNFFGFANEGWKPWRFNGLDVLVPERFNVTPDGRGGVFMYPGGDTSARPSGRMPSGGYYFDAIIRQQEIDDDRLDPADNLEEFAPLGERELSHYKSELTRAAATGRGVILSLPGTGLGDIALVPAVSLKNPRGIRDIEEWYISTVSRRDYLHEVFDRQTDIALGNIKAIAAAAGSLIDAVFLCGTDFGTQSGTFCSGAVFRELYLPYYKKMNDWIHAHTDWKIFKHSCGAVEPLLTHFIDAGFDILNPVQCSAAGMEPEGLKRRYGDRLVFWGGGVDTQRVLPFGTPDEVAAQATERCKIFAEGGGFVFNAIHNIQANTPVRNIAAMIAAVRAFNTNHFEK